MIRKNLYPFIFSCAIILVAAFILSLIGRQPWGKNNEPGLWSGNINSRHNSQFLSDPYSFTHITHGVGFYGLLWLVAPSAPLAWRAVGAIALESGWEVFENTDFVINRYRESTISLDYYGDSIVNSIFDILFMVLGFGLASRLPRYATIVGIILLEVFLVFWIRDSLLLNIIMLLYPLGAIRRWQMGG